MFSHICFLRDRGRKSHVFALLCLWGAKIVVATTRPNLQTLTLDLGGYTGKKLAMTRGLFYFFISPPGGQQIYTIYGLSEPVLCLTHLSKLI